MTKLYLPTHNRVGEFSIPSEVLEGSVLWGLGPHYQLLCGVLSRHGVQTTFMVALMAGITSSIVQETKKTVWVEGKDQWSHVLKS